MALAAPQGGDDETATALTRLIDLANGQSKDGVSHSGVLKESLALTTANLEVYHGLGRVPRYVVGVLLSAVATVYVDTPHGDPRHYVNVKASATCTANVLIA